MYEKETGEEMREKDDEFKELLNQQQERLSDCEKKVNFDFFVANFVGPDESRLKVSLSQLRK
jgi:hypothetical protein